MKKRISIGLAAVLTLLFFVGDSYGAQSGKPQETTILSLSDDANGCWTDQTNAAAGALVFDGALVSGGICKASSAQQLLIEGTGNNSGITFAIVGKGADNKDERETLTGANNGTAKSDRYYISVTSATSSAAITGDVEGGFLATNGAVSESLALDISKWSPVTSIVADITGTGTYTIDHTTDNTPSPANQLWFDTVGLAAQTTDQESNVVAPVAAVRARYSAYTSGTLRLRILQGDPQ